MGAQLNTDKLRELVDRVIAVEAKVTSQTKLSELASALANLANSPQDSNYQTQLAAAVRQFLASFTRFQEAFSPSDYERLIELSDEAFSPSITNDVTNSINQNAMTPAVANGFVHAIYQKRSEVFARIAEMQNALNFFNLN